tara:strand:- start:299 stop:847 length:549 start_codon:yes stop_codon:yes gene_type:complete
MKIPVTQTIRDHADLVLSTKNFGVRKAGFNGSRTMQRTGVIGELMIYKALDLPLPTYEKFSFTDIEINNKKIDIKTMGRKYFMRSGWVHNLVRFQVPHLVDYIVFNNYNRAQETMEIDGWLDKKTILDNMDKWGQAKGNIRERDDGTFLQMGTNNIEVPTEVLNKINTIEDLKKIGEQNEES